MDANAYTRKEVQTIPAGAGLHEAAEKMARRAVGSLVVVDEDGRATGILTDRDLMLRCVARPVDLERTRVADVMTSPFVSGAPEDDLGLLIQRMRDKGVRRIPICSDGRPVGIVALDDAIQVLARELSNLGAEARAKFREAGPEARFDQVRGEIQHRLEDVRERLQYASWHARDALLAELDELRERVRSALTERAEG